MVIMCLLDPKWKHNNLSMECVLVCMCMIGLRILPGIYRSEYRWLGFGGLERGRRRGAVGAGRARREEGEGGG
jgi:hypothetical protein